MSLTCKEKEQKELIEAFSDLEKSVLYFQKADQKIQKCYQKFKDLENQDPYFFGVIFQVLHILDTKRVNNQLEFYDLVTFLAKRASQMAQLGLKLKTLFYFFEQEAIWTPDGEFLPDLYYQKELLKNPDLKLKYSIRKVHQDEFEVLNIAQKVLDGAFCHYGIDNEENITLGFNQTVYVAQDIAGEMIGVMVTTTQLDLKNKKVEIFIDSIGKNPMYSDCKIGKKLLKYLIQSTPNTSLYLQVEKNNLRAFYRFKRLGFKKAKPCSKPPLQVEKGFILMKKSG